MNFEQGPVAPPNTDQTVVRDAITGISFHVEEAMTTFVLETLTTQHQGVDNRLSAALASLIEHIVKKMVIST